MLEKLKIKKKSKAAVPKVVKPKKQSNKKQRKKLTNIANKVIGAIPTSIKIKRPPKQNNKKKSINTNKKAMAAIPKKTKAIKKKQAKDKKKQEKAAKKKQQAKEKAAKKKQQAKEKATKKKEKARQKKIRRKETEEKNKRINKKIVMALEEHMSEIIRGTIRDEGVFLDTSYIKQPARGLDVLLKTKKAIVEEYPGLDKNTRKIKEKKEKIKNGIINVGQGVGSRIYEKQIWGVSDYVGALTGVRDKTDKTNIFTKAGAIQKGTIINGAMGLVDDFSNIIIDPTETLEGIAYMGMYPKEARNAIWESGKQYVNDKIIKGTPEEQCEALGQGGFEIALTILTAGSGQAASTTSKFSKTAKIADKASDIVSGIGKIKKTAKLMDTTQNVSKTTKVARLSHTASDASKASKATKVATLSHTTSDASKAIKVASLSHVTHDASKATKVASVSHTVSDVAKTKKGLGLAQIGDQATANLVQNVEKYFLKPGNSPTNMLDNIRNMSGASKQVTGLELVGIAKNANVGGKASKLDDIVQNISKPTKANIPKAKPAATNSGVNIKNSVKPEKIEKVVEDTAKAIEGAEKADNVITEADRIKQFNLRNCREQMKSDLNKYRKELLTDKDTKKISKICSTVDAEDLSLKGEAGSGIYQYNPTIIDYTGTDPREFCKTAVDYTKYYRTLLSDKYIDSLPDSFFAGKNKEFIREDMAKLRADIERVKEEAAKLKPLNAHGEPSFENKWNVDNCAEIWSARDAILNGARYDNLVMRTENLLGGFVEPCENCWRTFREFYNID